MPAKDNYDVIIIGGSYAGLSAAMSLGRSLRNVLIIDDGKPCNRFTPHSHNFLTQDGNTPEQIRTLAKEQVQKYNTIKFYDGFAVNITNTSNEFQVSTSDGNIFTTSKIIMATGIKDLMPEIKGFADCWGISVIHCPYCHGYEFRGQKTGVLANGEKGYHYAKLISNVTKELFLFTNGKAEFSPEQLAKLKSHNIPVVETCIREIRHKSGYIESVKLENESELALNAFYNMPAFELPDIVKQFNLEMTERGFIKVNELQRTSVNGIFACGDISNGRSVSAAVASGTTAGAAVNMELIEESF